MTHIAMNPAVALCHVGLEWALGAYMKFSNGVRPTELFVSSGLVGTANRLLAESPSEEIRKLKVTPWLGLERESWFVAGPCGIVTSNP